MRSGAGAAAAVRDDVQLGAGRDQLRQRLPVYGAQRSDSALAARSIGGLSGVTHIGGNVTIIGNPGLSSLDGFDELRSINGSLIVQVNSTLADLDGLAALSWVGGTLQFASNPMLPASEIAELQAQLDGP